MILKFTKLTSALLLNGAMMLSQSFAAPTIVGGYSATDVSATDVKAAAQFAVKQHHGHAKLIKVKSAQVQIVAGRNFRLCLLVKSKSRTYSAEAVVYHNLTNQLSLASWANKAC